MTKNLKINMHLIIEINKCIIFTTITFIQSADNTVLLNNLLRVNFIYFLTNKFITTSQALSFFVKSLCETISIQKKYNLRREALCFESILKA